MADSRTVLRNSRTHLTQRVADTQTADVLVALAKIAIPDNAPVKSYPKPSTAKRRTKITK